jgi:hypothetical protein
MIDDDNGGDEQDMAEAFDETHREGEDPNLFDVEDALDPDLDSRAYDVTRASGDEDEDDEDEDDLADDDLSLQDFDEEEDQSEDVEALQGEGLTADAPERDDLFGSDRRVRIQAGEDEPDLALSEDLDAVAAPRDRQSDKFESNGPLSDEQIRDLGYAAPQETRWFDDDARVDESLEESFPASDPPAARRPV